MDYPFLLMDKRGKTSLAGKEIMWRKLNFVYKGDILRME
jgi:hypothetical protein